MGDLIHSLPLAYSVRDFFKEVLITIPVVDRHQKETAHSLGGLFDGIFTFSYRRIKEEFERRRMALYQSKDFKGKYQMEAEKRRQFEKEMYEEHLRGEEYYLAIIPRTFQIETISCQQQITLQNLPNINNIHVVDRNLRFAKYLGIQRKIKFDLNLGRESKPKDFKGREISLPEDYILIILSSGRPNKRWTTKGNGELAKFCIKLGYTPVLVGSREDYESSKKIETEGVCNLTNKGGFFLNLENFAKIAKDASVVIGPDTGLIHIADAIGTKVIGLYGPTRPSKFAPYNNQGRVVSVNHTTQLMSDISSKEVISKLERVLTQ